MQEATVLVHVDFDQVHEAEYISEFRELAVSAGALPVALVRGARDAPDPKYFVGKGKAEEILEQLKATHAELVLFNHVLSPAQKRNLEKLFQCRVLDRTELILDIFAQRARTFEGKLQVELARLQYLATRLVRGWTHLERQKGGIGLRGGPGETQLEVDRRLLRKRIEMISVRLEKVRRQRDLSRRSRRRSAIPSLSLVGYTNAGKSTLFNKLTEADVYVANQLFATLDPTLRRVAFPEIGPVVLADTVGFIRDLPHHLVDAFRATLEEVLEADLLLHVIDAHNPERQLYIEQVDKVVKQIGAEKVPQLQIFNKLDLLPDQTPRIDRDPEGRPFRVWVSAETGAGLSLVHQALGELLCNDWVNEEIHLTAAQGKLRAALYKLGAVVSERLEEDGGYMLLIKLPRDEYEKLMRG
ncbi:MAG TPA: ribosome rescue GTPase HflX [Gammaproteobacteria bacterium]|nr:ribosome rescue GTPase HflX [Gammaproteobacteria bacterium]